MARFTQAGRLMRAQFQHLDSDELLLERLNGREALSELFSFELDLLSENLLPISFDKVIGAEVCISLPLPDGSERSIHGIVSGFFRGMPVPVPGRAARFLRYRAVVVPRMWLLSKRQRCRVFCGLTVPQILKQVFDELDVRTSFTGTYPKRDHCVQYRETDLAFACRLMEDEGIYFYFEHQPDKHTLVLADWPEGHADVPGPTTVSFGSGEGPLLEAEDYVVDWEKGQWLASGKTTLWDYSFAFPGQNLGATRPVLDSVRVGEEDHRLDLARNTDLAEIFEFPGGYADRYDSVSPEGRENKEAYQDLMNDRQRVSKIRMEEQAAASLTCRGESVCRHFTAGHKFSLDPGRWLPLPFTGVAGPYVLTQVEHSASLEGTYTAATGTEATPGYRNRFQCLPLALPFRPRRQTPRPYIRGAQTAVVVGPAGFEIFPDRLGRVRIQFFWDRAGQNDLKDLKGDPILSFRYWATQTPSPVVGSCWARVAQSWAGRQFGVIYTPRVGQEVVVAFLEGNPDRPLIVGSVYNAINRPPFPLPAESHISGIKTQTLGGEAPQFSGLAFDDARGAEQVVLQSEKNLVLNAEGNMVLNIGGDLIVNLNGRERYNDGSSPIG